MTIKTLAKSLRETKKTALLTIFFTSSEVVFEIIIPLVMSRLIDLGVDKKDMSFLLITGFILLGLACMQLVTGLCSAHFGARASVGFGKNLRNDCYKNIQTFSFANIDKFSTESLVTRLTTDITNVQNAFLMIIKIAIRAPSMMIFAMIAAFRINVRISLIFIAVIPILFFLLTLIIRKVHPIFTRVFKTYDKLNNVVQENVRGIRVVKSFTREDFEIQKFNTISKNVYTDFVKAERIITLNGPIMQFFIYVSLILISLLGSLAVIKSGNNSALGLTTGQLTALMTYGSQILTSLMMISMVFAMITIAGSSAKRICEVIEEKSEIVNPENPVMAVANGAIDFDAVDFSYKASGRPVLKNINVHIRSGEMVGIVGSTGSAKSTLISLIPRLFDVTNGSVKVAGIDVRDYDLDVLRSAVAIVLQKNELFSGTVRSNLEWGNPQASDADIAQALKAACADEFIDKLELKYDAPVEQGGTNFSGGQKQRLCIARALLKKPRVLILDDSTSAVDTATDAKIQHSFRELFSETTKIIIAQRINSVRYADTIIVLDDGKISATGTHEQLLETSHIYQEMYHSQQKP